MTNVIIKRQSCPLKQTQKPINETKTALEKLYFHDITLIHNDQWKQKNKIKLPISVLPLKKYTLYKNANDHILCSAHNYRASLM